MLTLSSPVAGQPSPLLDTTPGHDVLSRGNRESPSVGTVAWPTMTRASLRSLIRDAWGNRFSDWRRFALFLTRNDADAEDLVDEAVVRTLRADPGLKSEGEVHAYIVTAIRNTWFKWSRVRTRRQAILMELRNRPEECASSALHELIEAEQQGHLKEVVSSALEKMQPEIRSAIGLYLLRDPGLTLREIAENQGISVSTAHWRVQTGLRILADELTEFDR